MNPQVHLTKAALFRKSQNKFSWIGLRVKVDAEAFAEPAETQTVVGDVPAPEG